MNKNHISLITAASLALAACSSSDSGGGAGNPGQSIDPNTQPDAVMSALLIKVGNTTATLRNGPLPDKTGDDQDPVIQTGAQTLPLSSAGSRSLTLDIDAASNLSSLLAKVVGSNQFAEIVLPNAAKAVQPLAFDLGVPANVDSGTFCVQFSVQDDAGRISAPSEAICFAVDDSVIDALQGTWDFACDGDAQFQDSFRGFWQISGNSVTVQESVWPNDSCEGPASDTYSESLVLTLGGVVQASDGQDASELDIENQTEGGNFFTLLRVGPDQFELALAPEGAGSSAATRFNSFADSQVFTLRDDTAKSCFNPVLYQQGTELILRQEFEGRNDGDTPNDPNPPGALEQRFEFTERWVTGAATTFDGRPAIPITITTTQGESIDPPRTQYYQVDFEQKTVRFIGLENDLGETFILRPGALTRYDVEAGTQYTNGEALTFIATEFNDDNELETTQRTRPFFATFVGKQTLDLQVGSVATCQFDYNTERGDSDGTEDDPYTVYYGQGSGLEALFFETEPDNGVKTDRIELLQGTSINGNPVY